MTAAWGVAFVAYASWRIGRAVSAKVILWMLATIAIVALALMPFISDFVEAQSRYTPMIGMLIPGLFAAGILATFYKRNGAALYTIYVLALLAAYIDLKDTGGPYLVALLAAHVPSSIVILAGSVLAATRASKGLWLTFLGASLISAYGITLAMADVGVALISSNLAQSITIPILFLSTVLLTSGLMASGKWMASEQSPPSQ